LQDDWAHNLTGNNADWSRTYEEIVFRIAKDHVDALLLQDDLPERSDVDMM
jgi:hypothetical protein